MQYLYDQNLDRGDFAYGTIYVSDIIYHVDKNKGIKTFDKELDQTVYSYFILHTQAPTSSVRNFNYDTSHPFILNNWHVMHNGVLTNDKELKTEARHYFNEVDSSIIPALLTDDYENLLTSEHNCQKETDIILGVLSKLEGTYSLVIYNSTSNRVYIARSGSTLFFNKQTREFSSKKLSDVNEEVPEGKLFEITKSKIVELGNFKSNSPFLAL